MYHPDKIGIKRKFGTPLVHLISLYVSPLMPVYHVPLLLVKTNKLGFQLIQSLHFNDQLYNSLIYENDVQQNPILVTLKHCSTSVLFVMNSWNFHLTINSKTSPS